MACHKFSCHIHHQQPLSSLTVLQSKVNGAYRNQSVFKGYISCFVNTNSFQHRSRNRYFLTITKLARIKYCHLEECNPLQHSSSSFLSLLAHFFWKKIIFSVIPDISRRVWKCIYGVTSSTICVYPASLCPNNNI